MKRNLKNGCCYSETGILHRIDGPAIQYKDGQKRFYINGHSFAEKDYWKKIHEMGHITEEELFRKLI